MPTDLLQTTVKEFAGQLLAPITRLASQDQARAFLGELGWDFPQASVPDFSSLVDHASELQPAVVEVQNAETDEDRLIALAILVTKVGVVVNDIRQIADAFQGIVLAHPLTVDLDELRAELPRQLLDYIIVEYFKEHHGGLYGFLRAIGVIEEYFVPATGLRLDYTAREVEASNLGAFLKDPRGRAEQLFSWGTNEFDRQALLDLLEGIFVELAIPAGQYPPHPMVAENLLGAQDATAEQIGKEVRITVQEISDPTVGYLDAALSIYPLPVSADALPGVALIPWLTAGAAQTISLGSNLELQLTGDLSTGLAIEIRPGRGAVGRSGLFSAGPSSLTGELKATLRTKTTGEPLTVFQGPGDSRLQIGRFSQTVGVFVDGKGTADTYWELNLEDGALRIAAGEGDGFLQKILPKEPIESRFDLSAGWSSERSVYFRGAGALEITIPIHLSLGPINLEVIYIQIAIDSNGGPSLAVALSASAKIGPIAASVEKIGLRIPISIPEGGGNAGPFQINEPVFLPPVGAGLAIDAGGVSGGGYVSRDEALARYAGILDLKFGEIGLTAIALITTKLPGGRRGYALFVNIGVTFSPPITLPYNFNLQGCGGLLALNRTMDIEALRSGLRNRTLDSILFPEDPILNANKIITDSERVFPIEEGRFVVGPMAKLGWGANGLIVADLAIVIELPSPVVIAILGQLKARFPKSDEAKVRLNLDVLGVLDIARKSLSIDSTLYDSKILVYELYGDSALRLKWGSNPVFALSIGGFHPKFSPPANFPKLRRLTVQLRSSNSLELSCTLYHALTSNSVQFGAKLRAHAEACGAALDGQLSFDSLIIFSPFEFDVGIDGKVSASYKGRDVASVRLSLDLSGPTPWHAKGKAKFSVLRWDVTARFSKTWGSDNKARLPKIDPLDPFMDEVELLGNWGASLLPRTSIVESLKSLDTDVASAAEPSIDPTTGVCTRPDLLAHPAGGLEFRQRYVPLALKLDMVANADVKNHFKFDVRLELDVDDDTELPELDNDPVSEKFARGQYKSLSKSDRLSKPSYEAFKAGVRMVPLKARLRGRVEPCDLEFESIVIYAEGRRTRQIDPHVIWALMRKTLGIAALKRSSVRQRGLGKFKTGGDPRVRLKDEGYVVVDKATLVAAAGVGPASGRSMTQTEAEDVVSAAVGADPRVAGTVAVVPESERVAA
jgi:hypothetical protein